MGKLTRNEWGTFQMLTFIHFRHEHFPGLINIFNFNLISSHNFTFSTCRQIFYIRIYLGQPQTLKYDFYFNRKPNLPEAQVAILSTSESFVYHFPH